MCPSPESSPGTAAAPSLDHLTADERSALLRIARASIEARLAGKTYCPEPSMSKLGELRGAFVTLYCGAALRGCIGYPFPYQPLHRAVAEAAAGAAFQDPRFPPLSAAELPRLRISISALSEMFPTTPEQIEIGKHGLFVTFGSARGLLLPQVAVEHGWTAEMFLDHACVKAGLPPDAWKCGAGLQAFTAEVFSD
jgi:AmmeMemoRadiSam system protein A